MSNKREKSQERLENSRVPPLYHKINADEVKKLVKAYNDDDEAMFLRIYPGLRKDGLPEVHLELVSEESGEICGTYNTSFPCPPDCNGG